MDWSMADAIQNHQNSMKNWLKITNLAANCRYLSPTISPTTLFTHSQGQLEDGAFQWFFHANPGIGENQSIMKRGLGPLYQRGSQSPPKSSWWGTCQNSWMNHRSGLINHLRPIKIGRQIDSYFRAMVPKKARKRRTTFANRLLGLTCMFVLFILVLLSMLMHWFLSIDLANLHQFPLRSKRYSLPFSREEFDQQSSKAVRCVGVW